MKKAKESVTRRVLVFLGTILLIAIIMASSIVLSSINIAAQLRLFPDIRFQQSSNLSSAIESLHIMMRNLDDELSSLTKSGQVIQLDKLSVIYTGTNMLQYTAFQQSNLKFVYVNNTTDVAITNLTVDGQTAAALTDQLMAGNFAFSLLDSDGTIDTGVNTQLSLLPNPYNLGYWSDLDEGDDVRLTVSLTLPLLADDWLQLYYQNFQTEKTILIVASAIILVCLLLLLLAWIYLIRHAGRQTASVQIRLSWFDHIYGDLLRFSLLLMLMVFARYSYNYQSDNGIQAFWFIFSYIVTGNLLLSLIRRQRAGILITQNLWYKIIHVMRLYFRQNSLFRKAVMSWIAVGLLIVVIPLLFIQDAARTTFTQFLLLLSTMIIYLPVFQWIIQFQAVNQAVDNIGREQVQCAVPQDRLAPDLQKMMVKLAAIGDQTQAAVAEKLKSERLKTDLITNVSHDLKTPLTSIINYLDLLKLTADDPAKRSEYLGVLEQKAQRLKALTENLTEAAKASSGSLPVQIEPVNLNELVRQVVGEYADRLAGRHLALVVTESKDESGNTATVLINSDGRHIWRILDNLLTNVCKYAQEGTRVYLDLRHGSEMAALEIKNISQEPLNCSPDELQQRFVRGDESRHTEGSGLGLAIATSLAELLGGKLQIRLDGDLFKAILTLPL